MIDLGAHRQIHELIRKKDTLALFDMKTEAMNMLRSEQAMRQLGAHNTMPHKEIEMIVELVVKIEAYELGMGWLARTKRRLTLIKQYAL